MRLSVFFGAALLVCGLSAYANGADDLKASNPKSEPGKQVLMTAKLPASVGNPRNETDQVDATKTDELKFWFFFPTDESAKTDEGFPLMLFLHGSGERGSNPDVVKMHGPAKLCDDPEWAKTWKFITLSPQCPSGRYWSPLQLMALIDQVSEAYPVDRSRIYVTGLSMGGFGTWGMASLASDKIAAVAPVCGWYPNEKASTITTPVWAFHGTADGAVRFSSGRAIVDAVREAGNKDVTFTYYPGVPHDSWTRTYANPKLYDWFLSKKLAK